MDNMENKMDENAYESAVFTLTDEEGNEIDFEVIDKYEKNGETYFAMIPIDAEDITDGDDDICEYVILKLEKEENGEEFLVSVDDDDEFDDVADYFDDYLAEEIDYDEEASN